MSREKDAKIAIKGLVGWYQQGGGNGSTWSCGCSEDEISAPIRVDISESLESDSNALSTVWKRPNLDLNLPDSNVRSLFEGCIGHEGNTKGHAWDGRLDSLKSTDAVGLTVYVALLEAAGGKVERS